MLKRILIPVDTSEYTDSAIRIAADMARQERQAQSGAVTLVGLGLIDTEQMPSGRFAKLVPRDEILKEAETQINERIAHFRSLADSLGVPADSIETRVEQGPPFRKIIHNSVVCDLVAMGMRCSFPPINQDHESLSNIIHSASRPVVIADENYSNIERVLMVMDGTAPSSRMIYAYALLNPMPLAQVTLLHSQQEVERYPSLTGFFERAAEFLREHGIDVKPLPVPVVDENVIEAITQDEQADMIALGVHASHFMDHLRDPLNLRQPFVERLLKKTSASLFTVA